MGKLFLDHALLAQGWTADVALEWGDDGIISAVSHPASPASCEARGPIALPGIPNLHSHAFQRGMAGLTELAGHRDDSFWTWRQTMYQFLGRLTPDHVAAIAAQLYVEMLKAGFTSVGEFHYLHHGPDGAAYDDMAEMAAAIANAAGASGIGLTLLPVRYAAGDFGGAPVEAQQRRFATTSQDFARIFDLAARHLKGLPHAGLGIAPHSLRAVTPDILSELVAAHPNCPIHMHVAEQPKEVAACQDWSGERPVAWLLDHCDVDPRWCLIHATHMTESETRALAQSGAVAGLCPITEANLGDGLFNAPAYWSAGGAVGIGTDSNIRVDAAEELRLLEYGQRLRSGRRNVLGPKAGSTGRALFDKVVGGGHQALARSAGSIAPGRLADIIVLDDSHEVLTGRREDAILDSWIFAGDGRCVRDIWVAGRRVVQDGRHFQEERIGKTFRATMAALTQNW